MCVCGEIKLTPVFSPFVSKIAIELNIEIDSLQKHLAMQYKIHIHSHTTILQSIKCILLHEPQIKTIESFYWKVC